MAAMISLSSVVGYIVVSIVGIPAASVETLVDDSDAAKRSVSVVSQAALPDAAVHHYNVCNNVCSDEQAAAAMDVAGWLFTADEAWTLSLNEVCYEEWLDIAQSLNVNASFVYSQEEVQGCAGPDQGFGNGILMGPAVSFDAQEAWRLTNPDKDCSLPTTECRTMQCTQISASVAYGSCTTHLDSDSSSLAITQAEEYIYIASGYTPQLRWLAGDFNLQPNLIPDIYPEGYIDVTCVEYCPTFDAHSNPTTKLDYIWAYGSAHHDKTDPYCPTNASDHCYTSGRVAWQFAL